MLQTRISFMAHLLAGVEEQLVSPPSPANAQSPVPKRPRPTPITPPSALGNIAALPVLSLFRSNGHHMHACSFGYLQWYTSCAAM